MVFKKAIMAFGVEDNVVEKFDAEKFAGGFEAVGYFDVFFAWGKRAGGMIVGDDDRTGAVGNGVGKDLARMDLRPIGEAD